MSRFAAESSLPLSRTCRRRSGQDHRRLRPLRDARAWSISTSTYSREPTRRFGRRRHSVQPDVTGFRTGVTTMVDAGTSGWRDFPDSAAAVIDTAQTRVLALINIVGVGMLGEDDAVDQNQFDMNPATGRRNGAQECRRRGGNQIRALAAAGFYFGGKGRGGRQTGQPAGDGGFRLFRAAKPYPTLVTDKLRPGDISTHFYRWSGAAAGQGRKGCAISRSGPRSAA